MSQVFKDIAIGWEGKDYVLAGEDRFKVICLVEDEVTIAEIAAMAIDPSRLNASKVAKGFAVILRFLGVTEVRDGKTVPIRAETVFARMFGDGSATDGPLVAVTVLLALIQPDKQEPAQPNRATRRAAAAKKPKPAGRVNGNR